MQLSTLLQSLTLERDLEQITAAQYTRAAERFSAYLQRPATLDDLQPDTVNAYLIWLAETYKLGPGSVINHRTGIVRLWNYAAEIRAANPCPVKRIRRPKQPQKSVEAWSLEQLALLLEAANKLPGATKKHIPASTLMKALLWLAYDTGLRPTDLRLLRWGDIDATEGLVHITQHKTSRPHVARLGPDSLDALAKLQEVSPDRQTVFPIGKAGIYRWEQILYECAKELGFERKPRQGCGTIRKTHATEVYRQYGVAAAAESLGHVSSNGVAQRHYIDSRVRRGYLPPRPHRRA